MPRQTNTAKHIHTKEAFPVIIGHVKDGVALAMQYGLPRPVIDFIETHHGTTLVEYFYHEAMRLQESSGNVIALGHLYGEFLALPNETLTVTMTEAGGGLVVLQKTVTDQGMRVHTHASEQPLRLVLRTKPRFVCPTSRWR